MVAERAARLMGAYEDSLEREKRNAIHLESVAHSLQALVRLQVAELQLKETAVSAMQEDGFAMPPWWQEEIHAALSHGTRFDLSSELEPASSLPKPPAGLWDSR